MPAKTEKLKETQAAETEKLKETQAAETEEQPAEAPDDGMVNIFLMRDSDKYKGDVFVQVNGRSYIVKRGKNVKVPKEVAEVLQNSQEQDTKAAEFIDQEVEKFENGLKLLI
jgi:hypothetical protein